jgi:hypothetical protein
MFISNVFDTKSPEATSIPIRAKIWSKVLSSACYRPIWNMDFGHALGLIGCVLISCYRCRANIALPISMAGSSWPLFHPPKAFGGDVLSSIDTLKTTSFHKKASKCKGLIHKGPLYILATYYKSTYKWMKHKCLIEVQLLFQWIINPFWIALIILN